MNNATEFAPGLTVQGFAPPLRLSDFKLIAFDMDSTLINIECIDEIADAVGKKAEVAAITEAAMRGEITDFKDSLRRRVALLKGVPADVVQATRDAAQKEGKEGHRLSLKMPVYLPVMQFADSGALREQLYKAYVTRASDQAPDDAKHFDNTPLMQEILALRQEEARLLGFDNYAQVSVVPKMAESPEKVTTFLRDLAAKARPFAEKDLADLREFATNALGITGPLNLTLEDYAAQQGQHRSDAMR